MTTHSGMLRMPQSSPLGDRGKIISTCPGEVLVELVDGDLAMAGPSGAWDQSLFV